MPGGDRTGPMTGRGLGYGGGSGVAGGANRGFRGGRAGRGGRGHRHMFHATGLTGWQRAMMHVPPAAPTPEAEKHSPQDEVESLRAQLDEVKKRLAELETTKTQE